jgi:hypothetical protein
MRRDTSRSISPQMGSRGPADSFAGFRRPFSKVAGTPRLRGWSQSGSHLFRGHALPATDIDGSLMANAARKGLNNTSNAG